MTNVAAQEYRLKLSLVFALRLGLIPAMPLAFAALEDLGAELHSLARREV